MEIKKCCFTGHRTLADRNALKPRVANTLINLIENRGVTDFYAGGAMGFDIMCEGAVLWLREKYPFIRLHLVLPCPPEIQTSKWNGENKARYNEILGKADSVTVLSDFYYNGCMRVRNERLVESADICVCCLDPLSPSSGTAQTVRLAQKKGIEIINLF